MRGSESQPDAMQHGPDVNKQEVAIIHTCVNELRFLSRPQFVKRDNVSLNSRVQISMLELGFPFFAPESSSTTREGE